MDSGGISISVPATWSTPQGTVGTAGYTTVSTTGVVGLIFDEADSVSGWGNSACTNGLTADTSIKHSGIAAIKCVNHSESNGSKWYKNVSAMNWSSYATVGFWIYSTDAINNGRLAFEYDDTASLASAIETLSLGRDVPANTWTYVSFNFGSAGSARTAITSYGFKITNLSIKDTTVYADSFSIGAGSSIVPTFSGNDIVVTAISLTNGQTITVTYGAGGGSSGAVAPSSPETSTFTTKSKTLDSGTLTTIGTSPTVSVVDTTAPTATLTAPANGATIHGSAVSLTATASDNVAIAGVKFYRGGSTLIGSEDTSSPYAGTLDTTALTDGSYSITAVARDTSNNTTTSTAAVVTVDNTGPVISSIATSTAATTATVTWTTNESADSRVVYGTSSGVYTSTNSTTTLVTSHSASLTGLSEATTYYFKVASADVSTNNTSSTEGTFRTTDVSNPSVSITAPSNGASIRGSSVAFNATSSDNVAVAGVKFYVDGVQSGSEDTSAPYGITLDTTSLSNGSHSLTAVSRDTSNNTTTSSAITVTVDNTAPTAAVTYSISHAVKSGNSLTITATFSEAMADSPVPQISISGANSLSATNMTKTDTTHYTYVHTVGAGNGTATVALATGTDVAGNTITATPSSGSTFTVDNTAPNAPTITSIAGDNTIDNSEKASIHVVGTAEANSLVSVTLSDGTNSKSGTQQLSGGATSFDITIDGTAASPAGLADGTITPSVTATDAAGNVSSAATTPTATKDTTIIGDMTAPSVSITAPSASSTVRGSSVTFSATASDNVSVAGVKFYIDGVQTGSEDTSSPYSLTFDSTSLSDGTRSLTAVARDTSNNTTTSSGVSVTVDNTAPIISSVSFSPSNGTISTGEALTMTITADASGYTAGTITVNGVAVSGFTDNHDHTYTVTYTVSDGDTDIAQNAQIPVSVSLVDAVGNTSSAFTTSPAANACPAVDGHSTNRPSVTVNQQGGQSDPTNTAPIAFNVVFSGAITAATFTTADITQNGTATGITWTITDSGDHQNFVLRATVITSDGTVQPSIAAGLVTDSTNHSNTASTATDNTVTYTTGAPVLSSITATPSSGGATITWTTDTAASSRISYGTNSSYGVTTSETNTGTRVTSHSVVLSGLVSCVTYHYSVYSADAASNSSTSGDNTFTTGGCAGNSSVSSENHSHSKISHTAGGSIDLLSSGKGLSLTVPTSFGSNDADFQIKKLNKSTVIGAIGSPSGYTAAGDYVYDLHALSDTTTAVSSFSSPLTVTLTYAAGDVSGLDESTLKIYRYDSSWAMLSNCSVNTTAKTVTCDTDGFSTFSIFGQATSSGSSSISSSGSGGAYMLYSDGSRSPALGTIEYQKFIADRLAAESVTKAKSATVAPAPILFTRNLKLGMQGDDVRRLQIFLNNHGYLIAKSGDGSPGHETNRFGSKLKTALIQFQNLYPKEILIPQDLKSGSGNFFGYTRTVINNILVKGL